MLPRSARLRLRWPEAQGAEGQAAEAPAGHAATRGDALQNSAEFCRIIQGECAAGRGRQALRTSEVKGADPNVKRGSRSRRSASPRAATPTIAVSSQHAAPPN